LKPYIQNHHIELRQHFKNLINLVKDKSYDYILITRFDIFFNYKLNFELLNLTKINICHNFESIKDDPIQKNGVMITSLLCQWIN